MKLGVIGGTALEVLALKDRETLIIDTAWGKPSGPVIRGRLSCCEICFINRHGSEHRIPPHAVNYRANIAALHGLGVEGVVAVNAVGGISSAMAAGVLALPDQIVDYTWGRAHTYSDSDSDTLRHVDFTSPYCPRLRAQLLAAARAANIDLVDGGVHGVTQGPRLETAAEILRMERDGCDLVGMTGMPEAGLARELGIPYASVALVVNPAAGKSAGEITMEDISAVMRQTAPKVVELLVTFSAQV